MSLFVGGPSSARSYPGLVSATQLGTLQLFLGHRAAPRLAPANLQALRAVRLFPSPVGALRLSSSARHQLHCRGPARQSPAPLVSPRQSPIGAHTRQSRESCSKANAPSSSPTGPLSARRSRLSHAAAKAGLIPELCTRCRSAVQAAQPHGKGDSGHVPHLFSLIEVLRKLLPRAAAKRAGTTRSALFTRGEE